MNRDNGEQPERFVSAFPALSDEVTDTDYPRLVIEALGQVLKADAGNRADSGKTFSRLPRR